MVPAVMRLCPYIIRDFVLSRYPYEVERLSECITHIASAAPRWCTMIGTSCTRSNPGGLKWHTPDDNRTHHETSAFQQRACDVPRRLSHLSRARGGAVLHGMGAGGDCTTRDLAQSWAAGLP